MNRLLGALALVASVAVAASPAMAASSFVQDGAGMFSADAIAQVDTRLTNFNAQTHKEVVVVTVPSLPAGQTAGQAADAVFAAQSVNGVLIYVAQNEHKIQVIYDKAAANAGWFTPSSASDIADQMGAQFKAGANDAALTTGVGAVLDVYRSHLSSSGTTSSNSGSLSNADNGGGIHFQMWWIILAVAAFIIIRALSRPRYYGPPGGVAPGPQGGMPMGYGGGYGGYGGYGGGGGFWSGLLGGLGGAWLGNEMFRGGAGGAGDIGGIAGGGGGNDAGPGDAGGWANDGGQIGGGGGADWGGGGWGGGGGGDFGGGGGGDAGGGGGGGW